ncbi:iron-sulfur cluster assembly scaffold protein [Futiania mangrovi]|uniref:Iron-sulfur cluster assembly scaffold protein n=1 Tax=Futiania mangrovi TaxID=2959716 RepID=A0A9J6PHJ2_9PROT|nr:iron-sulfur cluster assembly scaffold protein [Futiania mangrovii]MCP1336047.1 iron-sulfur cluster assembly scaffold protein [Futiania mangrovii]
MSDLPFTKEILRIAARATGAGRLDVPDGTATRRSPTCGDRITVDVTLCDHAIRSLSHDTRACVLCQASAAILAASAIGKTQNSLRDLRETVAAMLKEGGAPPAAPFADYALLQPAATHRNRHGCVLLPIDAALEALETAGADA